MTVKANQAEHNLAALKQIPSLKFSNKLEDKLEHLKIRDFRSIIPQYKLIYYKKAGKPTNFRDCNSDRHITLQWNTKLIDNPVG